MGAVAAAHALAERTTVRPEQVAGLLVAAGSAPLAHPVRTVELARRQGVTLAAVFGAAAVGAALPRDAVVTAELEIKYAGYFARERLQADRMRQMGALVLDSDLPYAGMQSLTLEARQKLAARSTGHAGAGIADLRRQPERSAESRDRAAAKGIRNSKEGKRSRVSGPLPLFLAPDP